LEENDLLVFRMILIMQAIEKTRQKLCSHRFVKARQGWKIVEFGVKKSTFGPKEQQWDVDISPRIFGCGLGMWVGTSYGGFR